MKEWVMKSRQSRRDFVKQACFLAVSASGLRTVLAQEPRYVTADTTFGTVRGVDVDGIKIFKGIPYAASTAGTNRFMPPVAPAKWTGVRDALSYGPSAPQREPGV